MAKKIKTIKNKKDVLRFKNGVEQQLKKIDKKKALTSKQFSKEVMKIIGLVKPDKKFKPQVYHSEDGDTLEAFWKNEDYYGEYINTHLTLYKSQEKDEVIGVCITFVSDFFDISK